MSRRHELPGLRIGAASLAALSLGCFDPPDPATNEAPLVKDLTAEPMIIEAGTTALITAGAVDPEGERLIFTWEAEDGALSSVDGPGIEWLAPATPGTYLIRVRVTDPGGLEDDLSFYVPVVEGEMNEPGNNPPVILSLVATPDGLSLGEESLVVVDAMDPDGDPLTYEWLMGIGAGDAEGTDTTWSPIPGLCCTGDYPVGVTIRDGRGGRTLQTVSIAVVVDGS